VVRNGVGKNEQAGLQEVLLDLVSEGTRGEATSNGDGTGVLGVLQDGTLTIRTSAEDAHISGVLNGNDHASSKSELLPGLGEVDQEDTYYQRAREREAVNHKQSVFVQGV
jgi:hypothetical protein